MIVQRGKSYRTRDGRKVDIVDISIDGFVGRIYSVACIFDGYFTMTGKNSKGFGGEPDPDFDLISPWETEDKSESKMKPDFAKFFKERNGYDHQMSNHHIAKHLQDLCVSVGAYVDMCLEGVEPPIKSVEPAPPGAGDEVEWTAMGPYISNILGISGDYVWYSVYAARPMTMKLSEMVSLPGFRVIKRAEPK